MEKTKVKVSVSGLSDSPGKDGEIAIVSQLVESFRGRQWYVSSLLSRALLSWFEKQVKDDVNCDIMLELDAAREHALKVEGIARKVIADGEAQAREHDRKLSQFRDGYEAEIENLKNELERTREREVEYADGLEKERTQHAEADRTIRQNKTTIDFLEAEIAKLKVRLYDLINGRR